MTNLTDHETLVRTDLETLGVRPSRSLDDRDAPYDVLVVGGGQSGMGAAFGLLRERVQNLLVLDENEEGFEGPWLTYARMYTLRTPKELTSIDLGVPSLTFRAYWSAKHSPEDWQAIGKIPREAWAEYLIWYRKVLGLPVLNSRRVIGCTRTDSGHYQVTATGPQGDEVFFAQKVVFATGIQGGGEWHVPSMIENALPRVRYAHTSHPLADDQVKDKRIAVLGVGASGFDNAQHALKAGATSVDVFARRPQLPEINPIRFMERTGLVPRYASLSDHTKYEVMRIFFEAGQPPTNDTFDRASDWPNFSLHLGEPWNSVREVDEGVEVITPKGRYIYDFLILSTGLVTDLGLRPELEQIAPKVARWQDRYQPSEEKRKPVLDDHPYLGPHFELLAKDEQDRNLMDGLYLFNYGALVSLGLSAAAVTGLGYAIPRLARGIADQLFTDNEQTWLADYTAFDEKEFLGGERAQQYAAEHDPDRQAS
ncbi:MAG: NAD(P)/FAD-dependent oxidoreductase [Pseudomonadota bacterium]